MMQSYEWDTFTCQSVSLKNQSNSNARNMSTHAARLIQTKLVKKIANYSRDILFFWSICSLNV